LDRPFFAPGDVSPKYMLYFPVVTMTTLGYGDLRPASMVQTFSGRSSLVASVAYVVGSLGQARPGGGPEA
jgi:hypothetical protein